MWKHFWLIALELILLVTIGLFGNLAASQLHVNGAAVWIILVISLLILIPTTWFRDGNNAGGPRFSCKATIPETVTFSFSVAALRKSLKLLFALALNGILFGWVVANASIFAVRVFPELRGSAAVTYYTASLLGIPPATSFEMVGVFTIGFGSLFISKRLSTVFGTLFAATASLAFSITHLTILPYQAVAVTIVLNLASSLAVLGLGLLTYPIWRFLGDQIVGFWSGLLQK